MDLKSLIFFGMIIAVSGCWAWAFGSRREGIRLPAALMGVALSPALVSLSMYGSFIALSYAAPFRNMFIISPLAIALIIAWRLGERPASLKPLGSFVPALVLGIVFVISIYPFIDLLWASASRKFTPHDLSNYLLHAADLSQIMREGAKSPVSWWSYQHSDVSQPHSISFPLFLAWGFLFVDSPGNGSDLFPKLLVAWTILSLILACIAVCSSQGLIWGFAAGIAILANKGLVSQVWGLSRDSFYVTPAIVLIGLLVYARPTNFRSQAPLLIGQATALAAVVLGHSIGTVYAVAIYAGYFLAATVIHRLDVLRIPSIWLVGLGILVAAGFNLFRYFAAGAAAIGFDFPFYADPFQISVLKSISPFAVHTSTSGFMDSIFSNNGISVWWILPALPALGIVIYRVHHRRLAYDDILWLTLALSISAFTFVIMFFPIKLDGLSLSSAFVANFRYGFGLSIMIFLLIICSSSIVVNEILKAVTTSRSLALLLNACAAAALALTIYSGSKADWTIYTSTYDEISDQRNRACAIVTDAKSRRVLIDDINMFYICRGDFVNVYSPNGVLVTGVEGSDNISAALDAQKIDAIVFYHSPAWWSGTRLYRFLKDNWILAYSKPARAEVFLRPER